MITSELSEKDLSTQATADCVSTYHYLQLLQLLRLRLL